jgi:hypothetical protein
MNQEQLEIILDQIIDSLMESELDLENRENITNLVEAVRKDPTPANIEVLAEVLKTLSIIELEASISTLQSLKE